jgi:hypothetical protein
MPVSKAGRDRPIKYTDKSGGQPELIPIFNELKKLMSPYAGGHMVVRGDKPGAYGLWSDKSVIVAGRKHEDIYFAGLMVQKGFVGFYFMPVYACISLREKIHPDLVKCLKGKTCFHIKKNDPAMMKHVKDALKVGYDYYKEMDWV